MYSKGELLFYSIGGQTGEAAPLIILRCFFVSLEIVVIIFEDINGIITADSPSFLCVD